MIKKKSSELTKHIAFQTLTMVVTSLGLVAALAWNEAIKEYVNVYIKPYFEKGSGVISLFIYAVAITIITVVASYQLNKIASKFSTQE